MAANIFDLILGLFIVGLAILLLFVSRRPAIQGPPLVVAGITVGILGASVLTGEHLPVYVVAPLAAMIPISYHISKRFPPKVVA